MVLLDMSVELMKLSASKLDVDFISVISVFVLEKGELEVVVSVISDWCALVSLLVSVLFSASDVKLAEGVDSKLMLRLSTVLSVLCVASTLNLEVLCFRVISSVAF